MNTGNFSYERQNFLSLRYFFLIPITDFSIRHNRFVQTAVQSKTECTPPIPNTATFAFFNFSIASFPSNSSVLENCVSIFYLLFFDYATFYRVLMFFATEKCCTPISESTAFLFFISCLFYFRYIPFHLFHTASCI